MNRHLSILAAFLLFSCQTEHTRLFDDVIQMAEFDRDYKPTLIQLGIENGLLEPLMQYGVYRIDSIAFEQLENSIESNERFKEGRYYLNIELDDFLLHNKLVILNMSHSLIAENNYDNTYYFYLLSDRKTFVICKVNH
ncbi:MAG: hypothetical protein DSY77_12355 [Bacteroidetes bacterium]|jgi:hypothetical protein|nr:MAG: hypothetical protein DSY77_12355 [Bacteroidota bacterium]